MPDRPRIIVALPDAAESAAVADWLLAEGFEPIRRPTPDSLAGEMNARPFDLLIADAALVVRGALRTEGRARRPLTPAIMIGDAASPKHTALRAHAMYLSRPIDRAMLVCFVSMAILDGRPIRRSVRRVVNRFEAMVNGVPSHIVDVSAEGVRVEVPRDRRVILPPYFAVRVPLVGVGITVRRMWAHSSSSRSAPVWYGGALSGNRPGAEEAWRSFVDTVPVIRESSFHLNPTA